MLEYCLQVITLPGYQINAPLKGGGLYQFRIYQELSDEKSKLWHYSPMTLYTMYQDELL